MTNRLCLGVDPSPSHFGNHTKLIDGLSDLERYVNGYLPGTPIEIFLHWLSIDNHWPGIVRVEPNASDSRLALAGAVVIMGQTGDVLGAERFFNQWWTPVKWDGDDDPDWSKSVGLEFEYKMWRKNA